MRLSLLCLALGVLAGCIPRFNPSPEAGGAQVWNATITSTRGSGIAGTARAVVRPAETRVTVNIIGAEPRTAHPWHIHMGTCDSGGAVVGSGGAYPPLLVGTTGAAQASTTVGVALNGGQNYHINVHASATEMTTIVACGDLNG